MATIKDHVFAKLVVNSRFATKAQVQECMEARNLMSGPGADAPKLWDVMIQKGYLTQEQFDSIIMGFSEKSKRLFGEIALKWNMVTRPQLDECLETQKSMRDKGKKAPRIGQILVSKNYLKKHQVMAILEEQNKKIAQCPSCKAQFNLSRVQKGQKFKCTQCGKVLKIMDEKAEPEVLDAHGTMIKEPEPEYKKKKSSQSEVGDYKILQKLGQDSTGLIYKARDSKGKIVALKVLGQDAAEDKRFIKALKNHFKTVKGLDHPNIKKMYSMGEANGTIYVAGEFVEGESLRNILNRDGKIGVRKSLKIIGYAAEALAYAHKNGAMHGDIRPSNILVSTKGDVILSNLGLETKTSENILNIVDSGQLAPFYIAPETVLDDRESDFRADIYSLGATLYHIIAGRPPFEGQSPFEVLMRFTEDYLPPIHVYNPETPPGVAKIIEKMVAAEPDERYDSYESLLADLNDPTRILAGKQAAAPLSMKEDTRLESLTRSGGGLTDRPGFMLLVAGVCVLALGGVLFGALASTGASSAERELEEFKKFQAENVSKLDRIDEIIQQGTLLKGKYPEDKQLQRQVHDRITEAERSRDEIVRTEIAEVEKKTSPLVAAVKWGEALAVVDDARGRHGADAWTEAVDRLYKTIDGKARQAFGLDLAKALEPVRKRRPEQLTDALFQATRDAVEGLLARYGNHVAIKAEIEQALTDLDAERTATMAELTKVRMAASTARCEAVVADVEKDFAVLHFAAARGRIDGALAERNAADLPVVLEPERGQLGVLRLRADRLAGFVTHLTARIADQLSLPVADRAMAMEIFHGGRDNTIERAVGDGLLDVRPRGAARPTRVEFKDIPMTTLVAMAGRIYPGLATESAQAFEIGYFSLHVAGSAPAGSDARRTLEGQALHFLSWAVHLDGQLELPEGYAAVEADFLAAFDARLAAIEGRIEAKDPMAAVETARVASEELGVFRLYELRRERVDQMIRAAYEAAYGSLEGVRTFFTFDEGDGGGWATAPTVGSDRPDGGLASVAPGASIERVEKFGRLAVLYRTHEATDSLKFTFPGTGDRKVPLSIEPSRVALDFMETIRFKDPAAAPTVGVWHLLEIWIEGKKVHLRLDGTHELVTREDRGLITAFEGFELENATPAGSGRSGRVDLDFLLLK